MSVGEIKALGTLLGVVLLTVVVPVVLVAALSIWLWKHRKRPYLAWGVVVGGVVTWLVCALVAIAVVATAFGDQPSSRIWLENDSGSDVFLVTPKRDPLPGSAFHYSRITAGDRRLLTASSWSSRCLPPAPGDLFALPDGFSFEHFEDVEGRSRSIDPDPGITSFLVGLPKDECFDSDRTWLIWTGTELKVTEGPSPYAGAVKFVGLILIVTLCGGYGIDLLHGRSLKARQ